MAAASIIFFAFYGFDAVSTAAEEARDPARDMTIGIVGSMAACVIIYMLVAVAAIGAAGYLELGKSAAPLVHVMEMLNQPTVGTAIATAALVALPSVILVMMYGQSRIFFVMARDGLLPRGLGKVSPKTGSPVAITAVTGVFVAVVAGFFRLDEIAELANAGTLLAFIAVGVCVMVLRRKQPELPRVFRCPQPYVVGTACVLGCIYLLTSLPSITLIRFVEWNIIGVVIYFAYSRARSLAGKGAPAQAA
jgi:basic amino acid/polyamine antiporter, APA family